MSRRWRTRTRALVAVALTAGCAAAAAVVVLLGWAVTLGRPLGTSAWFAAVIAVAAAVPLTRPWVERAAERAVYGADGDPYAVLSRFVDEVSGAIAVDDVLPQLARAAADATHSPSAQATVRLAGGQAYRQTWPPDVDAITDEVAVPVEHAGRLVGELGVQANRAARERGSEVLNGFAGPAGLALANVGLTFELRRELAQEQQLLAGLGASRERLLVAAADQRAAFVAAVRGEVLPRLEAAQVAIRRVAAGEVDATDEARAEAQQALDALRGLAARVYQVTLAERGLVAALARFVTERPGLAWAEPPPELPDLPRPLAEAAYFAVVALAAGMPAGASGVTLRVGRAEDGELVVRLTGPAAASARSLLLARDRAEAVGGSLQTVGGDGLDVLLRLPADVATIGGEVTG